ncbi:MAG: NADH-quinone oxidoreductase subunit J [Candidatus Omnitrophica bacterium CG11_big_fil_rev_8_21_14_0_20_64_10]|nr:MAG: NADH-quinone oxidoreductase subunit J [Candidatus Omnitrophica bacterium CG11_big_fil_rev_8_21_14_0_20_64_10]
MSDPVGPLEWAAKAAFYCVAALTLLGGWFAVSQRNLFRAALGLALALFGVAVLYLFLQAEFLAVAQLLVYVGAILMLIIFGVMLTAGIADPAVPRWNRQAVGAALACGALAVGLVAAVLRAPWLAGAGKEFTLPLEALGRGLLGRYLLPFELLSLLLLGALIGALHIARKEKE